MHLPLVTELTGYEPKALTFCLTTIVYGITIKSKTNHKSESAFYYDVKQTRRVQGRTLNCCTPNCQADAHSHSPNGKRPSKSSSAYVDGQQKSSSPPKIKARKIQSKLYNQRRLLWQVILLPPQANFRYLTRHLPFGDSGKCWEQICNHFERRNASSSAT